MKQSVLVTSVLVAIAVAAGFFVGRGTAGSSEAGGKGAGEGGSGGSAAKSDGYGGGSSGRRGGKDSNGRRSAAAAIRKVARELEMSPMANMDFDAMFEAYEQFRWMTPDDIRIALEELEAMGGSPQSKMMLEMMLMNRWAKQDGRGAVEYAMTQKSPMTKMMGMMGGLMGWVKQDPDEAYTWYQENRDEMKGGMFGRGGMDGMFFAAFAQRDMHGAFERLGELGKKEKQGALTMMASQVTMDPLKRNEFIAELDNLGDDDLRNSALEGMMSTWAFQDPEAAAEFIESRDWEGDVENQMRTRLADSWANMDAEAALTWRLENLGEDDDRGQVVASGFSQWMTQDPDGAQEWLRTQPDEVLTDGLFTQTADQLRFREDYGDAVQWADQIEDQTTRETKLRDIYGSWSQDDAEQAQQWLNQQDEATRQAMEAAAGGAAVQETNQTQPTTELQINP